MKVVGQVRGWSIGTMTVPLRALVAIREEEKGHVLLRKRVVRFVLYLRAGNGRGTESQRYSPSVRARKPARRNSRELSRPPTAGMGDGQKLIPWVYAELLQLVVQSIRRHLRES